MFSLLYARLVARPLFQPVAFATRRTLFTSPSRRLLASSPRCISARTTGKSAATATRASKPKKAAAKSKPEKTVRKPAAKELKPKKKKKAAKPKAPPKFKISPEDIPPSRPGNAYSLFLAKYMRGLPAEERSRGREDNMRHFKSAGSMWHTLTEAEKQPFHEEHRVAQENYEKEAQAYVSRVDPTVVRQINAQRKKKGMPRLMVRAFKGKRRPASSFARFVTEFSAVGEGKEMMAQDNKKQAIATMVRAAATHWRSLSDAEKAPYREAFVEAAQKWREAKASKANTLNS